LCYHIYGELKITNNGCYATSGMSITAALNDNDTN